MTGPFVTRIVFIYVGVNPPEEMGGAYKLICPGPRNILFVSVHMPGVLGEPLLSP